FLSSSSATKARCSAHPPDCSLHCSAHRNLNPLPRSVQNQILLLSWFWLDKHPPKAAQTSTRRYAPDLTANTNH
ncbi:unnamed protein product, partial [Linum tenue]